MDVVMQVHLYLSYILYMLLKIFHRALLIIELWPEIFSYSIVDY